MLPNMTMPPEPSNMTGFPTNNSLCPVEDGVIYWALHCYGVTIPILISNFVLVLIAAIIIFLNIVSTEAVLNRDEIQNDSDIFIASLALSDTVVGAFMIYQVAYNLGNWQVFHECLFRYGILTAVNISSMFHLCLLTLDRYIKITQPYRYQRLFNKKTVIGLSAAVWLLSFLIAFLPSLGWNIVPPPTAPQCGFYYVTHPSFIMFLDILFLVPVMVNIAMYGHIFKVVNRHAKAIAVQQVTTGSSDGPSKATMQFTKTVCLITGLYLLCWIPTGIFHLMDYCGHLKSFTPDDKGFIMMYLQILAFMNSIINPIIYATKIPYIKQRFMKLFCKEMSRHYNNNSERKSYSTGTTS